VSDTALYLWREASVEAINGNVTTFILSLHSIPLYKYSIFWKATEEMTWHQSREKNTGECSIKGNAERREREKSSCCLSVRGCTCRGKCSPEREEKLLV
jgi:hypothetical protein